MAITLTLDNSSFGDHPDLVAITTAEIHDWGGFTISRSFEGKEEAVFLTPSGAALLLLQLSEEDRAQAFRLAAYRLEHGL